MNTLLLKCGFLNVSKMDLFYFFFLGFIFWISNFTIGLKLGKNIGLKLGHTRSSGGARLVDPPGRASLWRHNTSLPVNENDHRLNCGGFEHQWLKHKGKCGPCGDPYGSPKSYENDGKYDTKIITKEYTSGAIIQVAVEIISDLRGYIEFRLCDTNNNQEGGDCFETNILTIGDLNVTRYNVWNPGYHVIPLKLPVNLECTKCTLQMKYHSGYLWGCDGSTCCYGCGPMQEEFYSCTDVRIISDENLKFSSIKRSYSDVSIYTKWWCIFQCAENECDREECSGFEHLIRKRQTAQCRAKAQFAGLDSWCQSVCGVSLEFCLQIYCTCDGLNPVSTTTTTTPTTTPGILMIFVSPTSHTAKYGDPSHQIQCYITGSPSADMWYWTKTPLNGGTTETIPQTTNNANYIVNQSPTEPHLTILGILSEDQADYTCHASNAAGERSSTRSRLYVEGGLLNVDVKPTEKTATIGDPSVTLECDVMGTPEPVTWYWQKLSFNGHYILTIGRGTNNQDFKVSESASMPSLIIKDLTTEDEGDYECYAINIAGISVSNRRSRLLVKQETTPNIVKLLATAGCQYCNSRNNVTCSNWYCSEDYTTSLDYTGTLTEKVNKLADDFCAICTVNDTNCQNLFCLPNRLIVSMAIEARCNICRIANKDCQYDQECNLVSNDLEASNLQSDYDDTATRLSCRAIGDWEGQSGMDMWCNMNCPETCPSAHCLCSETLVPAQLFDTCQGDGIFAYPAMNNWCKSVCIESFYCPQPYCSCTYNSDKSTTDLPLTIPTQLVTTQSTIIGADLYSANAMNGIMCSVCSQNITYEECSTKYCEIYNTGLQAPTDYKSRVLSFSPNLFCDLRNGTNTEFCGQETVPDVRSVLCTICQSNGGLCDDYCL